VAPRYQYKSSATDYTSDNIAELVEYYARLYGVEKNLVFALIRAESNFDPHAVSSAGARGLMQLMPETAADMGVTDIFDPAQNIAGGTQYLAKMLGLFNNDVDLALAAYNAGPNAVKEYNGIPPYAETQNYVKIVRRFAGGYIHTKPKPNYRVLAKKPKAEDLPDAAGKYAYEIYFRSGYTHRVNKIIDEDPYYYVVFDNRTALVRKEHVTKIVNL